MQQAKCSHRESLSDRHTFNQSRQTDRASTMPRPSLEFVLINLPPGLHISRRASLLSKFLSALSGREKHRTQLMPRRELPHQEVPYPQEALEKHRRR